MTGLGASYITETEAAELLDSLVELEAMEVQILESGCGAESYRADAETKQGETIVRMPYMMNDAVEYYLEFQGCTVRGEWDAEDDAVDFSFVENGPSHGLILRQFSGNTVTIWYQKIFRQAECYQYHRIGHMWRKTPGEENLRRLVNLLCVMHDKVSYLGGDFYNETEKLLFELAEFGPLRYFTPINESILEWYPETEQGAKAMLRLANLAGDDSYVRLVEKYMDDLHSGRKLEKKIKTLAKELLKREHVQIYQTLENEIVKASSSWKVRDYGPERNAEICKYRADVERRYLELGYEGIYPKMEKRNGVNRQIVQFVEEQPFTVLEYDDYEFRIFSIHAESKRPFTNEMRMEPHNM